MKAGITFLLHIKEFNSTHFERTLESLRNQSDQAFELFVFVDEQEKRKIPGSSEYTLCVFENFLSDVNSCVKTHAKHYWTAWVGLGDTLDKDTVETVSSTETDALILYSDEQHLSKWGWVGYVYEKPPINPTRLIYQNYIQDLCLVQTVYLKETGFSPYQTNDPMHGVIASVARTNGSQAFHHIQQRLYNRHWQILEPMAADPRDRPYVPSYDLQAVKGLVPQGNQTPLTEQVHGIPQTIYGDIEYKGLCVFLQVPVDITAGIERLLAHKDTYHPRVNKVFVYMLAENRASEFAYMEACSNLGYTYVPSQGGYPETLNHLMSQPESVDSQHILLLDGEFTHGYGLADMTAMLNASSDAAAIGATILSADGRLTQPGVAGWKYENLWWNHRGSFSEITVPHETDFLSPAALLIDSRIAGKVGSFNTDYPEFFAMDWFNRLHSYGHISIYLPTVAATTLHAVSTGIPSEATDLLRNRYGYHTQH